MFVSTYFNYAKLGNHGYVLGVRNSFISQVGQRCLVPHLGETPEPEKARDEVFSSLSEIFEYMERLVNYLIRKRRDEARWLGVLTAVLTWSFGVIGVVIVNFLVDNYATKYFIEHPGSNIFYFGLLLALSLPIGLIAYFYAKKHYVGKYMPWKKTLTGLKKSLAENKAKERSVLDSTLQLMDRTSEWFSETIKYKREESLIYGIVAFLITAFISAYSPLGLPVALLIGVIVWLYFRYEKQKEIAQQIKTYKAWRKKFEEGKDSFLESIMEGRA